MAQGSGLTRGDRNRNRKLAALRETVRRDCAVLAIDLGEDKQVAVVMDHEFRVLGRRTVNAKAHQLAGLLEWAAGVAAAKAGLEGLAVACEPTGHRWKALMGLADAAGHGFACVQPLAVNRARESDDYTLGKTDHRDAYLIGKLVIRLECYLPERADESWARLRHLGARRAALVTDLTAARSRPGTCWAAPGRRRWRPRAGRWRRSRGRRHGGDHDPVRRAAVAAAENGIRAVPGRGPAGTAPLGREAGMPRGRGRPVGRARRHRGVAAQRPGALERLGLLLEDWRDLRRQARRDGKAHARRAGRARPDGTGRQHRRHVRAAAAVILAESGDPRRFTSGRALVKHAGLSPSEHSSATMSGQTRISRRGRPGLRSAAWRAVWGALRHNTVLQARYAHLTGREGSRLAAGQARVACAAAVLRWL